MLMVFAHPNCKELDNGQISNNPIYTESSCSSKCFIDQKCTVDGYVGSYVMIENESQRIWNFTLEPGEMTSMHRHDFDYSFVAIKPSQLEVKSGFFIRYIVVSELEILVKYWKANLEEIFHSPVEHLKDYLKTSQVLVRSYSK